MYDKALDARDWYLDGKLEAEDAMCGNKNGCSIPYSLPQELCGIEQPSYLFYGTTTTPQRRLL
jgi:hypothetical protein